MRKACVELQPALYAEKAKGKGRKVMENPGERLQAQKKEAG
jgi:hypothetical protein